MTEQQRNAKIRDVRREISRADELRQQARELPPIYIARKNELREEASACVKRAGALAHELTEDARSRVLDTMLHLGKLATDKVAELNAFVEPFGSAGARDRSDDE